MDDNITLKSPQYDIFYADVIKNNLIYNIFISHWKNAKHKIHF